MDKTLNNSEVLFALCGYWRPNSTFWKNRDLILYPMLKFPLWHCCQVCQLVEALHPRDLLLFIHEEWKRNVQNYLNIYVITFLETQSFVSLEAISIVLCLNRLLGDETAPTCLKLLLQLLSLSSFSLSWSETHTTSLLQSAILRFQTLRFSCQQKNLGDLGLINAIYL